MEASNSVSKCNELLAEISKMLDEMQNSENSGDLDNAESMLEQIIGLFPDIMLKYGLVLTDRSKLDKAIDIFQKVVMLKPSSIAYNNLACSLAKNGDDYAAKDNFRKAIEIDPDNVDSIENLAGLCYNSNELDEAIELYEKMIIDLPEDVESLLMISNCYFKKGAYESAVIGYESVLRLDPDNEDAKSNLNVCRSSK